MVIVMVAATAISNLGKGHVGETLGFIVLIVVVVVVVAAAP